jgi:hypothetical protein
MSSFKVCIQTDKGAGEFLHICGSEFDSSRSTNKRRQDRKEFLSDVGAARVNQFGVDGGIQLILENTMRRREEVQSPQRKNLQRLDILLNLESGNSVIVRRFRDNVPFDELEIVHHVASTTRYASAFARKRPSIHSEYVQLLVGVVDLVARRSRID